MEDQDVINGDTNKLYILTKYIFITLILVTLIASIIYYTFCSAKNNSTEPLQPTNKVKEASKHTICSTVHSNVQGDQQYSKTTQTIITPSNKSESFKNLQNDITISIDEFSTISKNSPSINETFFDENLLKSMIDKHDESTLKLAENFSINVADCSNLFSIHPNVHDSCNEYTDGKNVDGCSTPMKNLNIPNKRKSLSENNLFKNTKISSNKIKCLNVSLFDEIEELDINNTETNQENKDTKEATENKENEKIIESKENEERIEITVIEENIKKGIILENEKGLEIKKSTNKEKIIDCEEIKKKEIFKEIEESTENEGKIKSTSYRTEIFSTNIKCQKSKANHLSDNYNSISREEIKNEHISEPNEDVFESPNYKYSVYQEIKELVPKPFIKNTIETENKQQQHTENIPEQKDTDSKEQINENGGNSLKSECSGDFFSDN